MKKSKRRYKQKSNSVVDFVESGFSDMVISEKSIPLKNAYEQYETFCVNEGIKQVYSKLDFRSALESEGYTVANSKKHANQVRIFGAEVVL